MSPLRRALENSSNRKTNIVILPKVHWHVGIDLIKTEGE